jgi:ABC-type branched-subunit amino acid transport system substrate-binding protein
MEGNTARGASSPAKPAWDDGEEVFIYAVSFSPEKNETRKTN